MVVVESGATGSRAGNYEHDQQRVVMIPESVCFPPSMAPAPSGSAGHAGDCRCGSEAGLTLLRGALGCTGSSAASAMLLMAMTMRMHISK